MTAAPTGPASDVCTCGHDVTDHGNGPVGCIHRDGCGEFRAASTGGEPTEALRDALRVHHPIMRSETGPFSGCRCGEVKLGQDVIVHVVDRIRAALAPTGPAYEDVACYRGKDDNGRAYCVGHGQDWPCATPTVPDPRPDPADPHPASTLAWMQVARGATAYCLHCSQPVPCPAFLERHDESNEHREICTVVGCRYPRTDAAVGR